MQLNEKQQYAMEMAKKGENLFITGSGGVGKSVLIASLEEHFRSSAVLLAPTGIAALNISGATLHRTFGLPFSIAIEDDWKANDMLADMFAEGVITTIIIDEISMVRADMFVAIDMKLRHATGYNQPFGGLQVILVGDFFQLPPVLTDRDEEYFFTFYDSIYCFETDSWDDLELIPIILDQVMRQDNEATVRALNAIRQGYPKPAVLTWFNKQCQKATVSDDAITLCITNSDANDINGEYYERNENPEVYTGAKIVGTFNERPVEEHLYLKLGCRVVLCANNNPNGYQNGECGEIIDFQLDDEKPYIVVQLDNGSTVKVEPHEWESYKYQVIGRQLKKMVVGTFTQFPIKLGYAITIHKSQGMTLDECILDLGSGSFAHGQTYVGLSRIRSTDHLVLKRPIYDMDIIVNDEVIEFYNYLKSVRNGNKM